MKLLIITQKVDKNDDILGFFHRWLIEFAREVEMLTVICLYEGEHDLPSNVRVFSLGKDKNISRAAYLVRFYRFVWQERHNYDKVLVHMNPIYVVLAGLIWRLWGKKIALWYTHKHVDIKLRIANMLVHNILTASKESFRLPSRKVHVMGHGIDVSAFVKANHDKGAHERLVTVGRISPIKRYDMLLNVAKCLKDNGQRFSLDIIGTAGTESDKIYEKTLHARVEDEGLADHVTFVGSIPHHEIPERLGTYTMFVHMSETGSLDKAFLEALSAQLMVVSCNDAARPMLAAYPELVYDPGDEEGLYHALTSVMAYTTKMRTEVTERLACDVRRDHELTSLVPRIIQKIS